MKKFVAVPPRPALNSDFGIKRYDAGEDPVDTYDMTSYLGTPVWSNLIFSSDGVDIGNPTTIDPNNGKKDLRIDTVLFDVELPKIIVKTEVFGRNGTVKEFISQGDYMIGIKGMIVSPYPNQFPADDFDLLVKYCELETQVPVISQFLDRFGITSIVIMRGRYFEIMGYRNQIGFEIEAVSDSPLEFQLNPNKGL